MFSSCVWYETVQTLPVRTKVPVSYRPCTLTMAVCSENAGYAVLLGTGNPGI